MLARLWRELGLADGIRLEINSIGDADERTRASRRADRVFRAASPTRSTTTRSGGCTPIRCASSTARIRRCRRSIAGAPKLIDRLGDASRAHFEALQALLARARHRVHDQSAAGARPRLLQSHGVRMGHRPRSARRARSPAADATTGCSSSSAASRRRPAASRMGIERMILLLQEARHRVRRDARSPTSCTPATRRRRLARRVAEALRDAGHAVVVNAGGGSFKSQMKRADASGARFALIVGDDEAAAERVASSRCAGRRAVSLRRPSRRARRAGSAVAAQRSHHRRSRETAHVERDNSARNGRWQSTISKSRNSSTT